MRIVFIFFLLCLPFSALANCDDATPYTPIAERYNTGLLFSVSKCDHPTSYIFGTYHSDDPKLKPLSIPVRAMIDEIDNALFEIVIDEAAQKEVSEKLQLPPSHAGLRSLVSNSLYQKILSTLNPVFGWEESMINRFKPWAIGVLSQFPASKADGIVLDEQLQIVAHERDKQVLSLESIDEQFRVFDNLPLEKQIIFLESSINDFEQLKKVQARLDALYMAQDLSGIYDLSDEVFALMAQDYPSLAHYLEHELIDARNTRMTQRAIRFLEKPTLIAVGALHLPGKHGMLAQLEEAGYRINVVAQ